MYYRGADIIVVGFDVTDRSSIDTCCQYVDECLVDSLKCVIVAVGNKIDLKDQRVISTAQAKALFAAKGVPYFEMSVKTGEGVDEMVQATLRLWSVLYLDQLIQKQNNNE